MFDAGLVLRDLKNKNGSTLLLITSLNPRAVFNDNTMSNGNPVCTEIMESVK